KAQQERRKKEAAEKRATNKAAQTGGNGGTAVGGGNGSNGVTFRFLDAAAQTNGNNQQAPPSVAQGTPEQRGAAIRQFQSSESTANQQAAARQIMIGEKKYNIYESNAHELQYNVSRSSVGAKASLIDRGANGGLWGSEGRVIERSSTETVSVSGIDGYTMKNVEIGLCAAKIRVK